MTKTLPIASIVASATLIALALLASAAYADESTARLGGGNAGFRGGVGASNANLASDILARFSFAATRGGQPEDVLPLGGNNGEGGEEGESLGIQSLPLPENANENASDHANGGASAGNGGPGTTSSQGSDGYGAGYGGNGGSAGIGGLVQAGDVVSNSTAVNMLNTIILRISIR